MDFDIRKFDEYREDNRREVKKARGGLPGSLWETYSSMANCYGGVIILGVTEDENGGFHTTGLKDAAKLKKEFWDCVNNRNKVSVNLLTDADVSTYTVDGDVIMVIRVPKAERSQKPVYINNDLWNGTFRRNWEGDYHCTAPEIKGMLRGGISDPRNKAIMKMLNLISIGERAGSGVPNIFSVWEEKGWKAPAIDEQYGPDRTTLTLAFIKKQAEKTSRKSGSIADCQNA